MIKNATKNDHFLIENDQFLLENARFVHIFVQLFLDHFLSWLFNMVDSEAE